MAVNKYSDTGLKKINGLCAQLTAAREKTGLSARDMARKVGMSMDSIVVMESIGPTLMSRAQKWAKLYDLKLVIEHDEMMVMTSHLTLIKEQMKPFEDDLHSRQWSMQTLSTLRRQREISGSMIDRRLGLGGKTKSSASAVSWESQATDPMLARYLAHAEAFDVDVHFKLYTRDEWAKRS